MNRDVPSRVALNQAMAEAGSTGAAKENIGRSANPSLSPGELHVLAAFWSSDTPLTVRQVSSKTEVPRPEVTVTLAVLRAKGAVCVLNTVIESYQAMSAPIRSSCFQCTDLAQELPFGCLP